MRKSLGALLALLAVVPALPVLAAGAPTLEELANAAYRGIYDTPVRLRDGRYEGEPFVAGSASRPTAGLVEGFRLAGDIDGDGAEEAVAMLWESSGGSGNRLYLAVVGRRGGGAENLATAPVGDRVQVRAARLEGGRIVLDVVQAGPGDAACCPGEKAFRTWALKGGELAEMEPSVTGRLSVNDLGGVEWVLRKLARDEEAPAEPEITLVVDGGRVSGTSGCNRYTGIVEAGESPGEIRVNSLASTRKACAGEVMSLEIRYLGALGSAVKFGFLPGRLTLATERDGVYGQLVFISREGE